VSKILTDIFFYITDKPHSRCTTCGTNLIKWCQRDHLLEGRVKGLRVRAAGLKLSSWCLSTICCVNCALGALCHLGCDFFSSHTNTQIYKSLFSISVNVIYLQHHLMCICFLRKVFFIVNTQIHITKRPEFYLCIWEFLFVAQINPPRETFICVTNS